MAQCFGCNYLYPKKQNRKIGFFPLQTANADQTKEVERQMGGKNEQYGLGGKKGAQTFLSRNLSPNFQYYYLTKIYFEMVWTQDILSTNKKDSYYFYCLFFFFCYFHQHLWLEAFTANQISRLARSSLDYHKIKTEHIINYYLWENYPYW